MQCPRCNAAIRGEHRFCTQCGQCVVSPCGQCGAEVRIGDRFCGMCGTAQTAVPGAIPPFGPPFSPVASAVPWSVAPGSPVVVYAAPPQGWVPGQPLPVGQPMPGPAMSVGPPPPTGDVLAPQREPEAPAPPTAEAEPEPEEPAAAEETSDQAAVLQLRASSQRLARARAESLAQSPGERRTATVLMLDVSGYTAMSETLAPEDIQFIINAWHDVLVRIITDEYAGWINKTMGDGVMATFGAPIAVDNAPERAVRAALQIQEAIESFAPEGVDMSGINLRVRIGIHSGDVVAGGVMADGVRKFDVLGSTVNIASRLESNAPVGGILVSEAVYRRLSDLFEFEPMGPLRLKNVSEPVLAHLVTGVRKRTTRIDAARRAGLSPLVGRDRELRQLVSAAERSRAGEGQLVSIIGEAGVGKSRLVFELKRTLGGPDEVLWLQGQFLSFGSSVAYLPFQDALRELAGIEPRDTQDVQRAKLDAALERRAPESGEGLAPALGAILSIDYPGSWFDRLPDDQRGEEIRRAVTDLIFGLAADRFVVLYLDDVHWADNSSDLLIQRLIQDLSEHAVLLIECHRPQHETAWDGLDRRVIQLERLSEGDSSKLLASLVGSQRLGPTALAKVLKNADGNPFYLEEFVRAIELSQPDESGEIVLDRIPDTVQEIIDTRLDRLAVESPAAWSFLKTAAVVGSRFSADLVERSRGMDSTEGGDCTALLVERRFLRAAQSAGTSERASANDFAFEHNLTHEQVLARTVTRERQGLHRDVAEAMSQLYAAQLDHYAGQLARHYRDGGLPAKALPHYHTAVGLQLRSGANAEVIENATVALGLLEQVGDTDQSELYWSEFLLWRAHAQVVLGNAHQAIADAKQGLEAAREPRQPDFEARAYERIAFAFLRLGEFERAKQYYRLAERMFLVAGQAERAGVCRQGVISILHDTGDYDAARRAYEEELGLRRTREKSADDWRDELSLLINLGSTLEKLGEYQKALEYTMEADRVCADINDGLGRAFMTANIAELQRHMGRFGEARKAVLDALGMFGEMGDRTMEGFLHKDLAQIEIELGEYQQALGHARDSLNIGLEVEAGALQADAMVAQAAASMFMGLLDSSWDIALGALDLARSVGHLQAEADCALAFGALATERGQLDDAGEACDRALQRAREMKNRRAEAEALASHGRVYLAQGDLDAARAAFDQSRQIADPMGARRVLADALIGTARALELQDAPDQAREAFQRALALAEDMGQTRQIADAAAGLGRCRRRAGDRQGALDLFVKAIQVAKRSAATCGPFAARSLPARMLCEVQTQTISLLWEMGAVAKPVADIDSGLLRLIEQPTDDPEELRNRYPELDSLATDLLRQCGVDVSWN